MDLCGKVSILASEDYCDSNAVSISVISETLGRPIMLKTVSRLLELFNICYMQPLGLSQYYMIYNFLIQVKCLQLVIKVIVTPNYLLTC